MKRICALAISGLFFLFCMSACGGGGSSSDTAATDGKTTRSSDLSRFSSDSELETYLKEGLRASTSDESMMLRYDTQAGAPEAANSDAKDSGAGLSFSSTNLQEAGVDEADIIKSDGKYLYIAAGQQEPVYYIMGEKAVDVSAEETGSDGNDSANVDAAPDSSEKPLIAPAPAIDDTVRPETEQKDPEIRVLSLSENPAQSIEIASISLKDFENSVNGLYLVKDRGNAKPDLLITTGGNANDVWDCWYSPWYWTNGITEIGIFDVSAPENPSLLYHIKLDGQMISSRRIGEKLYVVTRYTPNLPEYVPYPATEEQERQNETVLENAKLSDMLPKMEVNGESSALVASDQCWLPPVNEDRNEEPNLITVTAIDLANPGNRISETVTGPTETIYVSTQSIYLASTRYYYQPIMVGILEDADSATDTESIPPETTDIHKFTLTNAGPVYKGSGSVTGHLGWKEDQKPFRMGEYEGILRVATSLGSTWEGSATTRLTLLKEGTDSTLTETAHVDNIGETGESLYAVRYVGTRAYLVTFRVTDPLYIFDLSNPASPHKAGELHISGYSDYLHPIGENLLLGIGKDAVPDDASSDFEGRGAWYQGVKLSLFDVSNPSAPYEKKSIVIGKRGTESDALMDHHALAYLPSENGNPARLALPIRLHDTVYDYTDAPWFDPASPSAWYDWTHTGLYLFDISETDIVSTGKMIVEDRSGYEYAPWSSTTDRAVIVGGSVHYIHNTQVWSALWSDAENMSGPE
ncbi:MAG: beta-propeller domain-containing protein [Desulfococcaceae bacterium]